MLLRSRLAVACVMLLFVISSGFGQEGRRRAIPSVDDLVKQLDKNGDGKLASNEVSETRFSRAFTSWDADKDGTVTATEIVKFRRGRGIPVEGTAATPSQPKEVDEVAKLTIPDVDDLVRIGPGTRASRQAMQNSAFIAKTLPHKVDGNKYVILTDHSEKAYLRPLQKLAKHRDGIIVRVDDLALLYKKADEMANVRKQLRDAKVRHLAIAPRMESYRENMLLGMWELVTTIDGDPQLDAFPGLLLASTEKDFADLIDRSINFKPQSSKELRPFAISQVPSTQELRSLQKSGILRKLFAEQDCKTPTVGIYSANATNAPKLPGDQFWSYKSKSRGDFLKEFPKEAASEFKNSTLLIMHGHGVPGMSCGVDIGAIPEELSAKVVLCGSCFAAAPKKSDFPAMNQAPGGYGVKARDAFAIRTVDRGATVVFGHMRLSQGFPHLFPVLETWMKGKTVGEAYQELINALIEKQGIGSGEFVFTEQPESGRQPRQNLLLYVVIGDPAIQPFEQMIR